MLAKRSGQRVKASRVPRTQRHSVELDSGGRRIRAVDLRRVIKQRLLESGFSQNDEGQLVTGPLSKDRIRHLHARNREEKLSRNSAFIKTEARALMEYFASGREIVPEAIDPELVEVASETIESDIFRLATLLWSVPVSEGFGRRIRFLVRDRQNGKLIGLFALGDPVFNLSARDSWIGWNSEDRKNRLIRVMDAYVVGSVPPYSQLIGGKLVAALMGSAEVKNIYERKYLGRVSVIDGKAKRGRLVLLTTTSALGRSSLYNRLSIPGGVRFIRIGTTRGFGHFHLSGEAFELMRRYLEQIGHPYASGNRFGMGPNWRLRVIRTVLDDIGLDSQGLLKHGVEREVFAVPVASNWREVLLGLKRNIHSLTLPAAEIGTYCIKRWIVPRSKWDNRYKQFCSSVILEQLLNGNGQATW
jgi:hypothetical protein